MNTPIADFVKKYADSEFCRFHMPGHKGKSYLGCETYDITEVKGADALYEAEGIIAESEKNATALFGTGRTVYSTEGSSQCIRAMLYLALSQHKGKERPYVIASRNVHKAFLYAAALLDLDVVWLFPSEMHSLCSCVISPKQMEEELLKHREMPIAVYITSPDYLGGQADIRGISEICHKYGTILAVDNAHGAYLHFLENSQHPIDLGADICCDSAHKTLPVLTGGAYLQIGKNAPDYFTQNAKQAMALFGSTSPSYLTLSSLDLCNAYLENGYKEKLQRTVKSVQNTAKRLADNGWEIEKTEPLKLVLRCPDKITGVDLAKTLRKEKIECEYADEKYIVFMITPDNSETDLEKLVMALGKNNYGSTNNPVLKPVKCEPVLSIRQAVFSKQESVKVEEAEGRICASPTVGCPPAIPIVSSGEQISREAVELFRYYKIEEIQVVK